MVLEQGKIFSRPIDYSDSKSTPMLARVIVRNGANYTGEFAVETQGQPLWKVVRNDKAMRGSKGSRLAEGDVIRLGRVHLRVKQLSAQGETRPLFPELVSSTPIILHEPSYDSDREVCRVCLLDHQTSSNPLIAPCKCKGQSRFIHVDCLQQWMKSRLNVKVSGTAVAYLWRRMDCDHCKEIFPTTISYGDEVRDLIQFIPPSGPYIVLEDLRSANYMTRGFHVVSLGEDGTLRIGRSADCEIYLSDVSISRFHANIYLHKGGFFLEDRDSKFGTMVQVVSRLVLMPGFNATLQTKNVVLKVYVRRPFRLRKWCCCFYCKEQVTEASERDSSDKIEVPRRFDTIPGRERPLRLSLGPGDDRVAYAEAGATMRKLDDEGDILVPLDS